jgi:hypothetical protein
MCVDNYGGVMSTGKTPDSSTRALWKSYKQSSSSKAGGTGERNYKFGLMKYLCLYFKGDGFTSLPKESVLRIFIALLFLF